MALFLLVASFLLWKMLVYPQIGEGHLGMLKGEASWARLLLNLFLLLTGNVDERF